MTYIYDAACWCVTGKIRKKNEDNFFFDGRSLDVENKGLKHPVSFAERACSDSLVAVFDGMGGESYGEVASFTAAACAKEAVRGFGDVISPESKRLVELCKRMNNAVVEKQRELLTEHMGSTMVALLFNESYVYSCNLGDSRAYRLRCGEFLQLTEDHVERRMDSTSKKAPLTQHLGISPEELRLEPYIAKGRLEDGDKYLLCSDGLTDMLSNLEIAEIMTRLSDPEACVSALIEAAMEKGGRDNITAIVCVVRAK